MAGGAPGKTPAALESFWPNWVTQEDAAIHARVQAGDEDSIINVLLFGTSFTKQPRATETQLAGIVVRQPAAPPAAGRVNVRGVLVQPSVVLSIEPAI